MINKFVDFLERWSNIKENYDYKNPKKHKKEITEWKMDFLDEVETSPEFLAIANIYYEKNPVAFIEHLVITYDPKRSLGITPFVLFPKQQEFIVWLTERIDKKESGLVEKCREVGMSWMAIAWSVWAWRYRKNTQIGFGSMKEALVDKIGETNSIFGKIRMVIERMPERFLPLGFSLKKHSPFLSLQNPENMNAITGEGGDNIGRGGRSTVYFKDESAFYTRPELIEASLSQNTDVQIDISTPNGVGNPFHKKRFSGKIPVFTFKWTDDPRKDQEWYDDQIYKFGSTLVAQEIDIDYESSLSNIVIPGKWVKCAVELKLDIDRSKDKYAGFDVAGGGADKNAYVVRQDSTAYKTSQWDDEDSVSATHEAVGKGLEDDIDILNLDPIGVGDGAVGTLRQKPPPFSWEGIDSRHSPSEEEFESQGKTCQELFINRRAELFWRIRRRFEKTFEYVTKGVEHPHNEMISIPDDPQLILELSTPLYFRRDDGKIKIESKEDMRKRGVASPNVADALVISFAESEYGFLDWM